MSLRVLFAVAQVVSVAFAFVKNASPANKSGATDEGDADQGIVVPLKKLAVPVKRGNKTLAYKYTFAGNISLGLPTSRPGQDFLVIFDTGSGQVVVPHEKCESKACRVHKRYSETLSTSGRPINSEFQEPTEERDEVEVKFGTGQITGELVSEHVCIGNIGNDSGTPTKCVEMGVVTATEMSDSPFLEFEFDGIVGLGLPSLALTPRFSYLNRLAASGGRATFAFYLSPTDSNSWDHEITVAGYNKKRFRGPLNWSPLVDASKGFWQVMIKGIRVGNESLDVCGEVGCPAIVDTGSSHLGLPKQWVEPVNERLSQVAENTPDCRHVEAPNLHLDFEGFSLTLEGRDYMRKLALPQNPMAPKEEEPHYCRPKLVPVFIPTSFGTKNFLILGEPVFNRYYTVFEAEARRIGFGLARHGGDEEAHLPGFAHNSETTVLMQVTFEVEFGDECIPVWHEALTFTEALTLTRGRPMLFSS